MYVLNNDSDQLIKMLEESGFPTPVAPNCILCARYAICSTVEGIQELIGNSSFSGEFADIFGEVLKDRDHQEPEATAMSNYGKYWAEATSLDIMTVLLMLCKGLEILIEDSNEESGADIQDSE